MKRKPRRSKAKKVLLQAGFLRKLDELPERPSKTTAAVAAFFPLVTPIPFPRRRISRRLTHRRMRWRRRNEDFAEINGRVYALDALFPEPAKARACAEPLGLNGCRSDLGGCEGGGGGGEGGGGGGGEGGGGGGEGGGEAGEGGCGGCGAEGGCGGGCAGCGGGGGCAGGGGCSCGGAGGCDAGCGGCSAGEAGGACGGACGGSCGGPGAGSDQGDLGGCGAPGSCQGGFCGGCAGPGGGGCSVCGGCGDACASCAGGGGGCGCAPPAGVGGDFGDFGAADFGSPDFSAFAQAGLEDFGPQSFDYGPQQAQSAYATPEQSAARGSLESVNAQTGYQSPEAMAEFNAQISANPVAADLAQQGQLTAAAEAAFGPDPSFGGPQGFGFGCAFGGTGPGYGIAVPLGERDVAGGVDIEGSFFPDVSTAEFASPNAGQVDIQFAQTPFGNPDLAGAQGDQTFGGQTFTDLNQGDQAQQFAGDFTPSNTFADSFDIANNVAPSTEGAPIGGDFASMPSDVGAGAELAGLFGGLAGGGGGQQYAAAQPTVQSDAMAPIPYGGAGGVGSQLYAGASAEDISPTTPSEQEAAAKELAAAETSVVPPVEGVPLDVQLGISDVGSQYDRARGLGPQNLGRVEDQGVFPTINELERATREGPAFTPATPEEITPAERSYPAEQQQSPWVLPPSTVPEPAPGPPQEPFRGAPPLEDYTMPGIGRPTTPEPIQPTLPGNPFEQQPGYSPWSPPPATSPGPLTDAGLMQLAQFYPNTPDPYANVRGEIATPQTFGIDPQLQLSYGAEPVFTSQLLNELESTAGSPYAVELNDPGVQGPPQPGERVGTQSIGTLQALGIRPGIEADPTTAEGQKLLADVNTIANPPPPVATPEMFPPPSINQYFGAPFAPQDIAQRTTAGQPLADFTGPFAPLATVPGNLEGGLVVPQLRDYLGGPTPGAPGMSPLTAFGTEQLTTPQGGVDARGGAYEPPPGGNEYIAANYPAPSDRVAQAFEGLGAAAPAWLQTAGIEVPPGGFAPTDRSNADRIAQAFEAASQLAPAERINQAFGELPSSPTGNEYVGQNFPGWQLGAVLPAPQSGTGFPQAELAPSAAIEERFGGMQPPAPQETSQLTVSPIGPIGERFGGMQPPVPQQTSQLDVAPVVPPPAGNAYVGQNFPAPGEQLAPWQISDLVRSRDLSGPAFTAAPLAGALPPPGWTGTPTVPPFTPAPDLQTALLEYGARRAAEQVPSEFVSPAPIGGGYPPAGYGALPPLSPNLAPLGVPPVAVAPSPQGGVDARSGVYEPPIGGGPPTTQDRIAQAIAEEAVRGTVPQEGFTGVPQFPGIRGQPPQVAENVPLPTPRPPDTFDQRFGNLPPAVSVSELPLSAGTYPGPGGEALRTAAGTLGRQMQEAFAPPPAQPTSLGGVPTDRAPYEGQPPYTGTPQQQRDAIATPVGTNSQGAPILLPQLANAIRGGGGGSSMEPTQVGGASGPGARAEQQTADMLVRDLIRRKLLGDPLAAAQLDMLTGMLNPAPMALYR